MRAMQNIFASKVLLGLFFIVIFASLAYAAPEDGGDSNAELGLPSSNLPLQEQVEMLKKALRQQPQFS